MDWGFSINQTSRIVITVIFVLYSLFVIGTGYMVQRQNRGLSGKDKVTSFLTGGGGVSSFGIAMLSLTSVFSAGVMIGNVGRVYANGGLISCICFLTTAWGVFYMQGTLGKKMSIMKKRAGVESIIQAVRLRYNSKFLAGFLAVTMTAFLLSNMSSQYTGGAKMFAVMTGVNNYWIGILILGVVTIAYSATGGVKSMIRVAIAQGVIMMIASICIFIFGAAAVAGEYGSWANAVTAMLAEKEFLYQPANYTFLEAVGLCLLVSFSCTSCIHALPSTLTHDKSKTIKRGILLATIGTPLVNMFMPNIGYIAYLLNPALASGDLATPFVAGVISPSVVGGIVLSGTASALQSSCAAFMLVAATCIIKDLYKGIIKPGASDDTVAKLMPIFTLIAGAIGILLALYPMDLMATVNLFSNGGMVCGLFAPLVFGLHWKKATPAGAIASSVGGIIIYIGTYILSSNAATAAAWKAVTGNANPIMVGAIIAILILLVVSKFTKKVELGVAQVWFGKTYDEKYTKFLN